MVARILLILALILPMPAAAQPAEGRTLEGSWALQLDGTTIFRFDIEPAPREGEWRGTWSRPSSFASDGNRFGKLTGPVEQVKSMAGIEVGDEVELSFNDARPGAIPDIFRFRRTGADTVEMTYVGTELAPYTLVQVPANARLGPWDTQRVYVRSVPAEPRQAAEEDASAQSADSFELTPGR